MCKPDTWHMLPACVSGMFWAGVRRMTGRFLPFSTSWKRVPLLFQCALEWRSNLVQADLVFAINRGLPVEKVGVVEAFWG